LTLAAVAWCGDFGCPTLFKAAITCDFKPTSTQSVRLHSEMV
jgi:hypothetical protein